MGNCFQKICVLVIAAGIGFISSKIDLANDYIWSIRGIIVTALMTMLTLYSTLSMNLVKVLDDVKGDGRDKAMKVITAMKSELTIELVVLIITFLLLVIFPIFNGSFSVVLRCIIDGLIVVAVVLFLIVIVDTFISYLDFVSTKKE